ncbi:MAG: CPBP family intramembrane metalloprotease, partial [Gemmatimonadetes bacterium]|nr:CPBP family intramembrane metalloprotease [Gemmatimonadota bacterium]
LLRPVVEEFFFRGVILQGLVERHHVAVAVLATALLSSLSEAGLNAPLGTTLAISALVQGLFMGAVLGWVRLATGSLLAAIGLQIATRGVGGLAVWAGDLAPVAGFNAPGDHTPVAILVPAAAAVVTGLVWLTRSSRGGVLNGVFLRETE